MKKKYYVTWCMCFIMLVPLFAQRRTEDVHYYPNFLYKGKWMENIFVSAGGGASLALSSYNMQEGIGKALGGAFYVYGGKHINPFWVWRAGLAGGNVSEWGFQPEGRTASYLNLHADLMCNLVNAFGGYRIKRNLVDVYAFAGPYLNFPSGGSWMPGVSAGGQVKFNLSNSLSIDLEARLSRQENMIDYEFTSQFDRFYFNGTIGVSYVFGGRTF